MSQNAKMGQYSTIKWNGTKLYDVKKIGSIPLENSEIDVTDLDSVAKEFIAGIKDYGMCSIEGNYRPTDLGQSKMEEDAVSGTVRAVEITLTSLGKTITFNAFVKSFKFGEATPEGVIPFTADLRITGAVSSTKADLTALTISDGTLTPAFSPTVYEYSIIATDPSVTVNATLAGSDIKVNGNTVETGVDSSAITIASGVTNITIGVTKTGGSSTYVIHVAKA